MSRRRTPGTHAGFWLQQQTDLTEIKDRSHSPQELDREATPGPTGARGTPVPLKDWWLWYASLPDAQKEKFEARAQKFRGRLGIGTDPPHLAGDRIYDIVSHGGDALLQAAIHEEAVKLLTRQKRRAKRGSATGRKVT